MKKKDLKKLTTRQLIEELRAKAGGVVNSGYRVETREEYREYLSEILAELLDRELSNEELEEIENLFSTGDSNAVESEEDTTEEETEEEESEEDTTEEETEEEESEEDTTEEESEEEESEEDTTEDETEEEESEEDTTEDETEEEESEEDTTEDETEEEESEEDTTEEESEKESNNNSDNSELKKWLPWGISILAVIIALIALITSLSQCNGSGEYADPNNTPGIESTGPSESTPVETPVETPAETEKPDAPVEPVFDIKDFKEGINNLIDHWNGDNSNKSDLILLIEKNGEETFENLCSSDMLNIQENVAHMIVHAAYSEMKAEISAKGWQYNPNHNVDYFNEIDRINQLYLTETGRDAETDYKPIDAIAKGDPELAVSLIGDNEPLLKWFTAKCAAEKKLYKEIEDTDKAHAYHEEVRKQLVASDGTIKLLKAQIEAAEAGEFELGVASEAYDKFIADNYNLVIVGMN